VIYSFNMRETLKPNVLRKQEGRVNVFGTLENKQVHARPNVLRRVIIDIDAATNGIVAGYAIGTILRVPQGQASPELALGVVASFVWLYAHFVGAMWANPRNLLIVDHTRVS